MMITIYGLPVTIKYQDLKVLIKQECNIDDFILDYLVSDGEGGKKVRVGLADDAEGSQLMKCLNGYRMSGHVLRLAPVGKSGATNSQPQTYTPRNNFPRNDYSGQTDHGVKPVETRPAPWSTNPQWTANPVAAVNTYNYQQSQTINTPYVQPQAAQAKPQFEPRELATANRVQPHSHTTQSYNYPSKSNLISLGPHRNVSAVPVHNISDSSTRMQASRYPPTYEPEKPITMMKDFQTPQYSSTQTGYQSQTMPWTGPQQQKPYEKPSPVFEKKYDERKYPPVQNKTDITKESFKYDKPEYARYSDDRRQMSPQRHMDRMPIRNLDRQPDRQSERLIDRPSDRHIDRPSDRHIDRPSDRHIDRPSDRNIDRPSDRNIDRPSDRNIDRPSDRHIDRPSDRNIDRPFDRNIDRPTDRHIDRQSDRHIDRPTDRHIERTSDRHIDRQLSHSSGMQRISPSRQIADRIPGRRISPDMTRMDRHSPTTHSDRRYSANHQMGQSPTRKMSPHRRISPTVRKEEYTRRRLSPPAAAMDRHTSRQSPSRMRHDSPTRQTRYSPRHDKPRDYEEHRAVKEVRPAYETQASKEAMYAGGYRPNVHVDVQYQRKDWQDREKQFSSKNIPEDRRDVARMQKFDIPRASDPQRITEDEKKRSRSRTSRSPRRSPVRDRFRRHSPSPRSPRRSWALEKRRSPETREPPPPPTWPGQDGRLDYQQQRPKFTDRVEKKVWEPSQEKKCDDFSKNDRRNFEDQRVRADVPKWKPLQVSPKEASRFVDDDRFQKEAKYARKDFEGRHALSREDNERKAYPERRDKDYPRSERDETRYKPNAAHKDIIIKQHEEYTGTIEEKKKEIIHKQHQLQKEIDEVYKRAVDFTKKAEMYKKGELKKDFQYRDDKEYDERHKYSYEDDRRGRDDYRKEYPKNYSKADEQKFGNFGKSRDSEDFERKFGANAAIKIKRIKAMDEISEKILNQYASDKSSDIKKRISEELKLSIGKILVEMFGDKDVSFIEMLVKFNARHTQKDEERIFEDVMSCLPTHYRTVKRPSKGDSGISSKVSRRSAEPNVNIDQPILNKQLISDWNYGNLGIIPGNVVVNPTLDQIQGSGLLLNTPIVVPVHAPYQIIPTYQEVTQSTEEENKKNGHSLYICKDDFQPILEHEAEQVKSFLVQELIKVTETSQGWAPDFTLSTQHTAYRHEVLTRDERSKNWLLSLDFSDFKEFNVLVYTTEELWYERAAIWLPGHSGCRKFDPLTKLKLQNRKLEGVNIGKWKFVKKIVTVKGTRVYVDMPPSSARALEKHKMLLSYELQKVNVFLKAVAIDKDAFDAGLSEPSIKVLPNPASYPMPSLGKDPNIIKIALKGNKPLNLMIARKIKYIILVKLFKYHQLEGKSRTDFIKYGFCQPGFFGVIPENEESRKWLLSLDIPRINRQPVIIVGADENKGKYFKMNIIMPNDYYLKSALAFERLRQSNQGVKGVNFDMWRNLKLITLRTEGRVFLEVDMDLESVETLSKMNYKLDYVEGHEFKTVHVESQYTRARLEELIENYKNELSDSYDVYNMDLESDTDRSIICLD